MRSSVLSKQMMWPESTDRTKKSCASSSTQKIRLRFVFVFAISLRGSKAGTQPRIFSFGSLGPCSKKHSAACAPWSDRSEQSFKHFVTIYIYIYIYNYIYTYIYICVCVFIRGRGSTRLLASINWWDFENLYKMDRFLGILALTKSIGFLAPTFDSRIRHHFVRWQLSSWYECCIPLDDHLIRSCDFR